MTRAAKKPSLLDPFTTTEKLMQTFRMPRELVTFLKVEASQRGSDLTGHVVRLLDGIRTWCGLLWVARTRSCRKSLTIPRPAAIFRHHAPHPQALLPTLYSSLRCRRDLLLENLALRQQLATLVVRRRPSIRPADRAFWVLLCRLWPGWALNYYHLDRTHLGLDKDSPLGRPVEPRPHALATVAALPRVEGLHRRYYWRQAA